MESLGVAPMRFVVGTRLVAIWLVVPLIYIVALLVASVGSYLVVTVQIGNVTGAAFGAVNWGTQTVTDNVESVIKVFVMATVVALVGCYYGYRARGGAVGVGAATARSMMANLILVSVLNAIGDAAVFTRARVPIGG
jgi:phospholipid/cholesterol/gamma-HCH transport system permease protein